MVYLQTLKAWQTPCIDRVLIWGTLDISISNWAKKTVVKSSQRAKNFWWRATLSTCVTSLKEKSCFAAPSTSSIDCSKNRAPSRLLTFHTQLLTFSTACLRRLNRFNSSTQALLNSLRIRFNLKLCLSSKALRRPQPHPNSRLNHPASLISPRNNSKNSSKSKRNRTKWYLSKPKKLWTIFCSSPVLNPKNSSSKISFQTPSSVKVCIDSPHQLLFRSRHRNFTLK